MEHGLCYLAPKSIYRQNSPIHDSAVEKNPGGCAQAETTEPMRSISYSGGDRSGSHLWGTGRAIAFGIFLTSELRKKPESVYFRLLPVLIGWYMALKMAVFGNPNSTYAAEITFTTCDLCLKNPNAIALASTKFGLTPGSKVRR